MKRGRRDAKGVAEADPRALLDDIKALAEEAAAAPSAEVVELLQVAMKRLAEADRHEMMRRKAERHEMMRRNAQRNLRALLDNLEVLAEEAAAAPGTDKARRDLPEVVGELRIAVAQVESKMNPSGAYDLHEALAMTVHVVSLVSNDPALQAELEKLREKSNAPLRARQEAAIKVKKLVWQMHDNGRTAQKIRGDLAAEEPPIERSLSWIYATIAERSST
jgi:hypothetical protein